jgi:hypothetical protein
MRTTKSTLALFAALYLSFTGCDQHQALGRNDNGSCAQSLTPSGDSCVDPLSDPSNCGGCGHACAAGKVCQGAACVDSCSAGYTSCGGACVALSQNDFHCGSCDNYCSGDQHCGNNSCYSCPSGDTACYSQSGYWSCANFATDNENCGRCGNRCAIGQSCTSGTCR